MIRTRKQSEDGHTAITGEAPAGERSAAPSRTALRELVRRLTSLSAAAWFLILAAPMGAFLVAALPPFQGQDESYHFYRAYSISTGSVLETTRAGRTGADVSSCVVNFVNYHFFEAEQPTRFHLHDAVTEPACNPNVSYFIPFENTAIYSPIPYLPQVVALTIGRVLHLPIAVLFFAGRAATLLTFLGLGYLTLRLTPSGHSVILLVAAMPMTLLLAATYSADTITISLALLTVAAVLRGLKSADASWRSFAVASGAALGLSLSKPTYVLLALLLLLIPNRLFPTLKTALAAKGAVLVVIGASTLAWYLLTRHISEAPFVAPWMGKYNPAAEIGFILHHPLGYAKKIADLLFGVQVGNYPWTTFVAHLGYFRNPAAGQGFPPDWVLVIAYALLIVAYLRETARPLVVSGGAVIRAAFPAVLVVVNVLAIVTALYIYTVGPGGLLIVEGRYFLPLVAVPLLSLAALERGQPRRLSMLPLVPWVAVIYVWLIVKMLVFFY